MWRGIKPWKTEMVWLKTRRSQKDPFVDLVSPAESNPPSPVRLGSLADCLRCNRSVQSQYWAWCSLDIGHFQRPREGTWATDPSQMIPLSDWPMTQSYPRDWIWLGHRIGDSAIRGGSGGMPACWQVSFPCGSPIQVPLLKLDSMDHEPKTDWKNNKKDPKTMMSVAKWLGVIFVYASANGVGIKYGLGV